MIDETASAGAAIGSWRGGSANRACRVGGSLILADLIDLAVRRFKHCGDLGDLQCLWELGELVRGHCQIGAWSLVDVVAVNTDKIIVEVALEWPSLRVKLLLGHRKGNLVCSALCVVDVLVLTSGAFLLDFAISRGAIDADVEDCVATERRERKLLGEGFGKGLRRTLGLSARILLRNGLEGRSGASADVEHVDGRWRLVGERMDVSHLVGEFVPQGVLVGSGDVGEPEG